MKIELKIRRAGGSEVDLPNSDGTFTRYHFKALDPSRADSPHVADVDAEHADILLDLLPVAYVAFDAPAKAPPVVRPDVATPVADAAVEAADTNHNGVVTIAELNAGISAGAFTPEVLREMLEAEESADKPRKVFVSTIIKALK